MPIPASHIIVIRLLYSFFLGSALSSTIVVLAEDKSDLILEVSGEVEFKFSRNDISDTNQFEIIKSSEVISSADIEWQIYFSEILSAKVLHATETGIDKSAEFEQAYFEVGSKPLKFRLGKDTISFGESGSRLFDSPSFEFANIDEFGIFANYKWLSNWNYRGYVVREQPSESDNLSTYGFNITHSPHHALFRFDLGYINSLAGDFQPINNQESPGFQSLFTADFSSMRFLVEHVTALDDVLSEDLAVRPSVMALEAAFDLSEEVELGIRFERTRNLADAPRHYTGLIATKSFSESIDAGIEYRQMIFDANLDQPEIDQATSKQFEIFLKLDF